MPVSINGSGSITGVSSLTQLTKLGVTGILTATDFSGPSGGAADFPNGLTATTASFSGNLSVGGNLTVDGVLTYDDVTNIDSVGVVTARAGVKVPDNQTIFLGTGNDLQIYHDGSHSRIKDTGTGSLIAQASRFSVHSADDSEAMIDAVENSHVKLYHNGNQKLETTSNGISVTGDITPTGYIQIDDSSSGGNLYIGNSSDLKLFHNGTNSYIRSGASNAPIHFDNNSGVLGAKFIPAGAFELYHNGNKKFETTSTGASVTGNLNISGHTYLNDNRELVIGAGNDLKLYHNATNSYIDNATGDLWIRADGDDLNLRAADNISLLVQNNHNGINVYGEGPVDLYHNNSHKFSTTAAGAKVLGDAEVTGSIGISSAIPKTDLDASTKTGAVALPQGTTAQRPTGSAPYIRKNTTNNALEYFDGTSWVEIITDYFPTGSVILG